MIGTDIDAESLQSARDNVARNKGRLGDRIAIFDSTPDGPFFPFENFGVDNVDFTMCNPPFYESVEEMFASAKAKQLPPSSVNPLTPLPKTHFLTLATGMHRHNHRNGTLSWWRSLLHPPPIPRIPNAAYGSTRPNLVHNHARQALLRLIPRRCDQTAYYQLCHYRV